MKKIIKLSVLSLLLIPTIVSAVWWNPSTWKIFTKKTEAPVVQNERKDESQISEIENLKKEIEELKKEKADIFLEKKETTKIVSPKKVVTPAPEIVVSKIVTKSEPVYVETKPQKPQRVFYGNGDLDLSSYNTLGVSDYYKNHKASLNKPVKIIYGQVSDFVQSDKNYISISDRYDPSIVVNIRIDNDNDYTIITNELSISDNVLIYGYGENNADFRVTSSTGVYYRSEPVIDLDAIYKCPVSGRCEYHYTMGSQKIYDKKNK